MKGPGRNPWLESVQIEAAAPHLSQSKGCAASSLAHWHPRSAMEVSDDEEAILIFAPYSWYRAWQVVFVPSTFVKKKHMGPALKGKKFNFKGSEPSSTFQQKKKKKKIHIMDQKRKLAVLQPSLEPNSGIYMEQDKCFNMKTRQPPPHLLGIFAVMTLVSRI